MKKHILTTVLSIAAFSLCFSQAGDLDNTFNGTGIVLKPLAQMILIGTL